MPAGHDISAVGAFDPPIIYNDEGPSFVIEDTGYLAQIFRLTVSDSRRVALAGTARVALSDALSDPSTLRFRSPTSSTVNTDEYVIRHGRVIYAGNVRETIYGTGRSILLDDLSPRPGRLVLAGAGGGS